MLTAIWLIENGHPFDGWGPGNEKGFVFPEFHPYDWTSLTLAPSPPNLGVPGSPNFNSEQVSVAAPLYQSIYNDNNWWNNNITNDGQCLWTNGNPLNVINSVTANATIPAPTLPTGFHGASNLIQCVESGSPLIGSLGSNGITRSWTPAPNGLSANVTVTVIDPPSLTDSNGLQIADPNDPANGVSVYQGYWIVSWLPRLRVAPNPDYVVAPVGSASNFGLVVSNIGPDDLTISSYGISVSGPNGYATDNNTEIFNLPDLNFVPGAGINIPAYSSDTILSATFSPATLGTYTATVYLVNNDPVCNDPAFSSYLQATICGTSYLQGYIPIFRPKGPPYLIVKKRSPDEALKISQKLTKKLKVKPYVEPDLAWEELTGKGTRPETRRGKKKSAR